MTELQDYKQKKTRTHARLQPIDGERSTWYGEVTPKEEQGTAEEDVWHQCDRRQ